MSHQAIETHNLRKDFGTKLAVADLTLTVNRGEVFGFLGPNGAGKTTSIKMLLGLVQPTAGSGSVLGVPLNNQKAKAKIGFLPEHFRFHDWLTGREFLYFHGRLYGMKRQQIQVRMEELLVRVDMQDAADRKLNEYSKGMLQRIGLAQALLNEPELVFLDEPTSGLDPLGRLLVRDIIRDLRDQGTTVFLNSHLLSEIEVTCDRVVFVKQGRVVKEHVLGEEATEVEVELKLGSTTSEILSGLSQFGHHLVQNNGHLRLKVDSEARLPEIASWIVEKGVPLYKLTSIKKPLETVFLEIMGSDERPG